jgi:broad specificity phosphatase PhoE
MQRRALLAAAASPLALRAQTGATVLLLRHAQTEPGIGDPPGFVLDRCPTQRNLSDAGRAQARKLGAALRARGLTPQRVRSSRWCRCLDTARLAFGSVEPWAALDSFFADRTRADTQTAELRRTLAALPGGRVEAWVTHQVNISALTGSGAAMGEVLLLRAGEVVERIRTDP